MNILIIGKDSYIGNNIEKWLAQYGHSVAQLDVMTDVWKSFDYSSFDTIVHVAGIVHRPQCSDWHLYKSVNCDMPIAIAKMAKAQGVKAYIYFSTMGVYKAKKSLNGCVIDSSTPLLGEGKSMYGKSKLMAEQGLSLLQEENFNIAFIRPPSVYGKDCKGGYITGFATIAKVLPVIPLAYQSACQSFIYIDNLAECVRYIIEERLSGVFCPQDDETPCANRLFEVICNALGKTYKASKFLGLCMRLFSFIPLVNKAYGGISYARELSNSHGFEYVIVPFEEGMKRTLTNCNE